MDSYNYVIHPVTKNKIPIYTKLGKELVLKFMESKSNFKGGSQVGYNRGAAGIIPVKTSSTIKSFVTKPKKKSKSGDWKKVPNKKGKTKKYGHKKWEYNGKYKLDDDKIIYFFKRKKSYKKGDKVFIINKNDGTIKDYSGILYTHECGENGDDVCIDNQLTIVTNELKRIYNKEMAGRKRKKKAQKKQVKIDTDFKQKSDKANANWGKVSNTIKATAVFNKGKGYFSKFTEHIFPTDELTIPAKMEIYNQDITALHKDAKYEQIKKDDEWHLIDSAGSIHPHDTSIHPGKHSLLYWAHQAGFYGPEYFNEIDTYVFLPKNSEDKILLKDALEMSEEKLKAWINKRKLKNAVKKSQAVTSFSQAGEKKQAEDASKAELAKEGRNKLKNAVKKSQAVTAFNQAGEKKQAEDASKAESAKEGRNKLKKGLNKLKAVKAFGQAGEKKQAEDASKAESAKEGRNKLKKGLNKLKAVQAFGQAGEKNRIDTEANHLMREGASKRWGEPENNIKAVDGSDGDGKCYPNFLFQRFYQDGDGNWLSNDSEKDYIDAWKKSPLCTENRIYKNTGECRSKHYFRETDTTWENWDNSKNCDVAKSNLDIPIGEQKRWDDNKCYSKNAFGRFYEDPFTYEIDKSSTEKDWGSSSKCSDKRNMPGVVGGADLSESCGDQESFKKKFGEDWIDNWNSQKALDCKEGSPSTALVTTGDGNKPDTSTALVTTGDGNKPDTSTALVVTGDGTKPATLVTARDGNKSDTSTALVTTRDGNKSDTSPALVVTGDDKKNPPSPTPVTTGNVTTINSPIPTINKSPINIPNVTVMPSIPISTTCKNLNTDEFKNLSKLNNAPFPKSDTTNYAKLPTQELKKNIIIFGLNAVKEDGQNECHLAKHNYLMAVKIWGVLITKDPSFCTNGWEKKMAGYANRYYELGV